MTKLKLLACAAIAAFGAAACASSGGSDNDSAPASATASGRTEVAPQQPTAAPTTGTYSDAQLQAFAAASLEIDPISRTLAGATPDQEATAATQIRAILQRHNLDGETYNTIASRAQADPALAARVAAFQTAVMPPVATEPDSAPTTPQQ
jgi:hypothetical protein